METCFFGEDWWGSTLRLFHCKDRFLNNIITSAENTQHAEYRDKLMGFR